MQLYTKILIGMAIGVVLGFLIGPNSVLMRHDGVKLTPGAKIHLEASKDAAVAPASRGIRTAKLLEQKGEWMKIEWSLATADLLRFEKDRSRRLKAAVGDKAMSDKINAEPKLEKDSVHAGWVVNEAPAVSTFSLLGQDLVDWTEWLGLLFLALIKMVVVPLVFFSLTVGVASLGDFRRLGRMGGRTIGTFTVDHGGRARHRRRLGQHHQARQPAVPR